MFTDKNGVTWQLHERVRVGWICVMMVDGRATNRRAWFPDSSINVEAG